MAENFIRNVRLDRGMTRPTHLQMPNGLIDGANYSWPTSTTSGYLVTRARYDVGGRGSEVICMLMRPSSTATTEHTRTGMRSAGAHALQIS